MSFSGFDHQSLQGASDATLVVAVGRYNQEALGEIYRRHGGAMIGLSRRVLNDVAIAEDVVQEVFLRLWNDPARFDPERGALRSFLLMQVHGRSVDMLRSEQARRRREEKNSSSSIQEVKGTEEGVVDVVVAEEIRNALAALPDDERVPIELAYYGGNTYQETAARLGQPEGTIKSRIRTGLRRMRNAFPKDDVEASPL